MEEDLKLLIWLGIFTLFSLVSIVFVMIVFYQKNLNQCRRNQLEEELQHNFLIEHKERARIAKELHDGLCSDLATLKNYAAVLMMNKETDLITISDLQQLISQCYDDALHISYNLSPPLFRDHSIVVLLNSYLLKVSKVTSVKLTFKSDKQTFELSENKKMELYRIMQELVQNLSKHSRATYAEISLMWELDYFILSIVDNGVKYDFKDALKNKNTGLGLNNIVMRIKRIKAECAHYSGELNNIISLKIQKG
ncbi:histidine kinase [Myroides odoratimimus]|uniref:sensor histidine kinase n=1 Tax=Myroides odoratimimus TaxID=76832 RepID=UPI003100BB76